MTDVIDPAWPALNAQPQFRRTAPTTLRAAWWAVRAVRAARRDLKTSGLTTRVAPPPRLPWGSRGGVFGVLNRLEPTCLERALVLQAWIAAFGPKHDVVVGVRNDDAGAVKAHAWLDQIAPPHESNRYQVIHRLAPR